MNSSMNKAATMISVKKINLPYSIDVSYEDIHHPWQLCWPWCCAKFQHQKLLYTSILADAGLSTACWGEHLCERGKVWFL